MYHPFLPADEIPRLITPESVRNELKSYKDFPDHLLSRTVQDIVPDRMKLFAILTMMGKGDLIIQLIQEGIADAHLPFTLSRYADTLSCQVKSDDDDDDDGALRTYNIHAFAPTTAGGGGDASWHPRDSETFFDCQWELLAPHLDLICPYGNDCPTSSKVPTGYSFGSSQVLPFLKPDSTSSNGEPPVEHFGGFSLVVKVEIHPAHRSHCLVESCVSVYAPFF